MHITMIGSGYVGLVSGVCWWISAMTSSASITTLQDRSPEIGCYSDLEPD